MHKLKVCFVLGTRPEIIKLSPILRECQRRNIDFFMLHTGQHYSYLLDKVFFEDLGLPLPDINLCVGSGTHGSQTGRMLEGIEKVLLSECPDLVLVQGDTNSALAGALASSKLNIKIGHVEAGLRCYEKSMPEETNRVLIDHCSDFLFAPTELSKQNLLNEGLDSHDIFVTGNTVVDVIFRYLKLAEKKSSVLDNLCLTPQNFALATIHRCETVDSQEPFSEVIEGLKKTQKFLGIPLVFPIHPHSRRQLEVFRLDTSGVTLVEPLSYFDFLLLESSAKLVLTDSGGVQEECCVLGVPCVTLRNTTERPETLNVGANILGGVVASKILSSVKFSVSKFGRWINPFGDGETAKRIMDCMMNG